MLYQWHNKTDLGPRQKEQTILKWNWLNLGNPWDEVTLSGNPDAESATVLLAFIDV